MKTQSSISDQLARISRWGSHSPIRNLTPLSMTRWLEEFRQGYYFNLVEAWDEIAERDDVIPGVISKRSMNVSSCDGEVIQLEDTPEAEAHAEALRECYDNITATDAVDLDLQGGMDLLIRQIMRAVGQKKTVHEIVWQPGSTFTAELRHISLRHFEGSTGRVRFAPNGTLSEGGELLPGEWMVSATDMPPLMKATGIAYLYKTMPLRDWLTYSECNGLMYVLFKTRAAPGSKEWQEAEAAVAAISGILGLVVSEGTESERMGAASGELPYPALIERMDRRISSLWMGADLSTISADNKGASVQGEQERLLLEHDCKFVSNQINLGLGRHVIANRFGEGVRPLAYYRLNPPMDIDEEKEQGKFTAAIKDGIAISERQYREELGLREPADAADALRLPGGTTFLPATVEETTTAANEATTPEGLEVLRDAASADFAGLAPLLDAIEAAETIEDYDDALEDLERALEAIRVDPTQSALAGALESLLGTAVVEGAAEQLDELENTNE